MRAKPSRLHSLTTHVLIPVKTRLPHAPRHPPPFPSVVESLLPPPSLERLEVGLPQVRPNRPCLDNQPDSGGEPPHGGVARPQWALVPVSEAGVWTEAEEERDGSGSLVALPRAVLPRVVLLPVVTHEALERDTPSARKERHLHVVMHGRVYVTFGSKGVAIRALRVPSGTRMPRPRWVGGWV